MEYFDPDSNYGTIHGAPGVPAYQPEEVGTATAPAPGPTPIAAAPKITTMAGFQPDYEALIRSSPTFIAGDNAARMNEQQAAAKRRAAIRAAYVRYGGDLPPGFQDQYGDLDQTTRDAAQGNQQSRLAQLAQNYGQSVEQFRRGLAARGGLQSSELDYGSDQLNRGFAQQRYDAGNAFLDEVNQDVSGYTGVLGQNAVNMANTIGTAEANTYANPAYRPQAPQYADYDASLSATHGQPLYSDGDGNLFDASGNPFSPPQQQASTPATPAASNPFNVADLYSGII